MPEPHASANVDGNSLQFISDGPARFEALMALLARAERRLRLLYYIFEDDEAGSRIAEALEAAAGRGVEVSLLVDGFGTEADEKGFFATLAAHPRVRFCRFVPKYGRRYLLRNHQKLAMADEQAVIIGGFNISDEYFASLDEREAWRDIGLIVEGPSVPALARYYDALFEWARDKTPQVRTLRKLIRDHSQREGKLRWLLGGPSARLSPWAATLKNDMFTASRLDMIEAYFAPNRSMLRRIYAISGRGTARIVTAAKSDNGATIGATRHIYGRLLKRDVEIYEYQPARLHTKLIVADDAVHIGSANFDMRSLFINLELMLRVEDADFAARMRAFVGREIRDSLRITSALHQGRATLWNRIKWQLSYFVVATMDYNVSRRLNFGLDAR
ncbi:MAG: phosphatidylserine/phosphatidylglycerophosphate/cardiolipin synthase family protein [Sphingomonadaceae bacterium]